MEIRFGGWQRYTPLANQKAKSYVELSLKKKNIQAYSNNKYPSKVNLRTSKVRAQKSVRQVVESGDDNIQTFGHP